VPPAAHIALALTSLLVIAGVLGLMYWFMY
jgi:hypothetical protein